MTITVETLDTNGKIVKRRFKNAYAMRDYLRSLPKGTIVRSIMTPFIFVSDYGYLITNPARMPKRKWGEIDVAWEAPHGTAFGYVYFNVDKKGNLTVKDADWCHDIDEVVNELSKWCCNIPQEERDALFDSAPHDWRFFVKNVKTARVLFLDHDFGFDCTWDMVEGDKPDEVMVLAGDAWYPLGRPL